MNDPLSMQKHLANSLNATFEDDNVVNLAGNAKIEHPELEGENQNIASLQGQISPKAVIAFDELQKKLQDNHPQAEEPVAPKTQKPTVIAFSMFAIAAIIIGAEYFF